MLLVVDASALIEAITSTTPSGSELRQRLGAAELHAPHLVDAETGNVLRRHVAAGRLPAEDALGLLDAVALIVDVRHPVSPALRAAAWRLRENVSFYDALYVALAGALDAPLLTADARLARAPELPCRVEVLAA